MNIRYIQRHHRGKPFEANVTPLSTVYPLDYMGSAEFENGAYAKIIKQVYAAKDVVHTTLPIIDNGRKTSINVFYSPILLLENKSSIELIAEGVRQLNIGKLDLKESAYFYDVQRPRIDYRAATIAWTDIRHGVFMTCDDLTLQQFQTLIATSVRTYASFENRKK